MKLGRGQFFHIVGLDGARKVGQKGRFAGGDPVRDGFHQGRPFLIEDQRFLRMGNDHAVLIDHREVAGRADDGFFDEKLREIIHSRRDNGRADHLAVMLDGSGDDKNGIAP